MKQLMKAVFCGLAMLLGCATLAFAAVKQLDGVAAVVNDSVITQSELNHALQSIRRDFTDHHMQLPPDAVLRRQVLEQLINRKLQLELATQANIKVTDTDVNQALDRLAKANKVTVQRLFQLSAAQGFTQAEFKKQLTDEIMIQRAQQQMIGGQLRITPQEVDNFMQSQAWKAYSKSEYHLLDILVPLSDSPSSAQVTAAYQHALQVIAKLHHGADFSQVAMRESNTDLALKGGDLGWRPLADIPSVFVEQVTHMRVNDISSPLRAGNGFHVIKLAGVRSVSANNQQSEKQQVEALLYQRKAEEALQSWITRLRSQAYIQIFDAEGQPIKSQ